MKIFTGLAPGYEMAPLEHCFANFCLDHCITDKMQKWASFYKFLVSGKVSVTLTLTTVGRVHSQCSLLEREAFTVR